MRPLVSSAAIGRRRTRFSAVAALVLTLGVVGCQGAHGSGRPSQQTRTPTAGPTSASAMPTATASTGTTAPPLSPSSRPAVTSPPTPLTQSTAPVPVGSSPASPTIAPTPTAQVVAGFAGKDIVRLPTTTRVVAL